MNIYLVSRTDDNNIGYDQYMEFVVRACSEAAARNTHPGDPDLGGWPVRDLSTLSVELIGKDDTPNLHSNNKVILASYNAG